MCILERKELLIQQGVLMSMCPGLITSVSYNVLMFTVYLHVCLSVPPLVYMPHKTPLKPSNYRLLCLPMLILPGYHNLTECIYFIDSFLI